MEMKLSQEPFKLKKILSTLLLLHLNNKLEHANGSLSSAEEATIDSILRMEAVA